MQSTKRNLIAIAVGSIIVIIGLAAIWIAQDYRLGTLTRMGPGFFPIVIGILVVVFGGAAVLGDINAEKPEADFKFRPVIAICAGMLAWTLLIDSYGILPSTFALIGISSLARSPFRPWSTLALCVGLCMAGYLVFVVGLGMPLTLLGR